MPDHLDSVKEYLRQMDGWRTSAIKKDDAVLADVYVRRIGFLQAAVDELEQLRRATLPIPASFGDISDLPPELLKELTGIKVDEVESQLFNIIKSGGDEVDLDVILIELYRRHQVIQTRKFLQNKLWRMAQKGVIHSVPGRKGVYSAVSSDAPLSAANPFDTDLDDDVPF